MVKDQMLSPMIRSKGGLYTLTIAIHHLTGGCRQWNKERKKCKEIEEEEIKLFVFTGDMTVYIRNLKESTK